MKHTMHGVSPESKIKGVKKEDIEESTVWVGGLDRINSARGILAIVLIYLQHHLHQLEKKQVKKHCSLGLFLTLA